MIRQCLIALTVACVVTPNVYAAGDEQKAALAKSQFMLRQLTVEKTDMEKKNKELDEANKTLKTQLDKAQAELASKNAQLSQLQTKAQEQQEALAKTQQESGQQQKELQRSAALVNHQKTNIEARLQTQRANLGLCMENNRKLYDINKELVANYQNKGFWAVAKQKEPFTGKQQVEIEKLAQEYQYRLDDAVVIEQGLE
ncbi:MAG TPA: hypothetical protein PK129_02580 [Cellvibrionaceae bacterium]|nr:hypothetical protein [Cellvibrionaceae bacterium]